MGAAVAERDDPVAVPEQGDRPIVEEHHPPSALGNLLNATDGHRTCQRNSTLVFDPGFSKNETLRSC
jgi:hypothetical protein